MRHQLRAEATVHPVHYGDGGVRAAGHYAGNTGTNESAGLPQNSDPFCTRNCSTSVRQVVNPEPSLQDFSPTDVRKLMDDLAEANRDRERLKQTVHEMENRLIMVEDEKNNIVAEYEVFQKKASNFLT